ncbi:MAG: acyltransferase domain-containing protein, partial [Anaerolineales bacterium]|nr:acyltransferase domain-containing protein [Anaerolineales bacterium]
MSQPDRIAQLKQVYLTIEKLQNKLEGLQHAQTEPIAIIGMGCRYPNGANSPEAFWELLHTGRDGITEVPPDRWNAGAFYDPQPDRPGKIGTRWGGFLDNVAGFDARFFGIAPQEAAQMDPQQRLLLEVAWEALEAAGQPAASLAGSATGVYIGMLNSEYAWLQFRDLASLDVYSGTGTSHSVASGRLSYVLGLQGPSVTLDTACSSSLVAIHLACQALRSRECDLALAGGVSTILSPLALMPFSRMGLLAADGRCKTLDARADGFGSGEGCGLLVLKRLSEAEAAGDPILALLRGSAVNQDGRTNVLSAPNGRSQEAVIRKALESARLEPADLSLIELHGTGTALGDPIETDALRAVFAPSQQGADDHQRRPVYLGAVKSNIGHTGAAAGVAGIIKVVLGMQHEVVPPNLHFRELNPHIKLENTPFAIPAQPVAWLRSAAPRFAGVSAFGWSGTNAHVIVSDPPQRAPAEPAVAERQCAASPAHILVLSARSEAALREMAGVFGRHLRLPATQAHALADMAYTAAVRRSHHPHRLAVVGASHSEAAQRLDAYLADPEVAGVAAGRCQGIRRRKLVFVFSPHGAQWLGMGRELWSQSDAFRAGLEACQAAMRPYVDWSLEEKLWAEDGSWLDAIDVLQPFLFAFQVALAGAWRAWGVEPDAVVGHSMGEVAAAHVAGVLSLDDAARIICRRAQLLRAVTGEGAMGVIELSYEQARAAIAPFGGRLSIAASNSPRSTILAGESSALETLFDQLQARGVFCGWGVADVASHSPRMAALNAQLRQAIGRVGRGEALLPLYSTVTGDRDDGRQFDADYWVRHLNQPVLFAEAARKLAESGHDLFLEIGPGPVLGPAIEEVLQHGSVEGAALASQGRYAGGYAALLGSLGQLYALGYPVKWDRLYPAGDVVPLPAYAWQRERFWLPVDTAALASPAGRAGRANAGLAAHAALGERLEVAGEPGKVIWERVYDRRFLPQFFQHRLFGRPVLPVSAYAEMAFAAAPALGEAQLLDFAFTKALILADEAPWTQGQLVLDQQADGSTALRFYSLASGQWRQHATGSIAGRPGVPAEKRNGTAWQASIDRLREVLPDHADGPAFYRHLEALGVDLGPELQSVTEIWWESVEALARVGLGERYRREIAAGAMPAAAIEPALQAVAWLVAQRSRADGELYAPAAIGAATWHRRGVAPAWVHVQLAPQADQAITGRAVLLGEDGAPLLALEDIRFDIVRPADAASAADWLYQVSWEPASLPDRPAVLSGRWLIFADDQGVGDALSALIGRDGGQVALIRQAAASAREAGGQWHIRSDCAEDYDLLFQRVPVAGLRGIAHLWSLSQAGPQGVVDDRGRRQTRHAAAVLRLVQALKRAAPEAVVPLWLVTRGAQPAGEARVLPEQATVWGLGQVLAEEHHELWGGLIDCDPDGEAAGIARHLHGHLAAGDGEDRVALRGERRLAARLAPCAVDAPAGRVFRPDGAYLITGGFGDIALAVARWAVGQGARRLILLGRSALPPRLEWRSLDPGTPAGHRAVAVLELEALGAAVHWGAVDVGDAGALAAYLDQYAAEGWPAIRGVIHSAAVIEDHLLVELDAESLGRVAHPKAAGAWHLHRYFLNKPLDFFLLFSSSGALMGAAGQGSYAAANAYLDALAHARRASGLPALSINWGFWEDLGFARTPGGQRAVAYMSAFGMASFRAGEALAVLAHLLARPDLAQAAALKMDWERWRSHSRLVGVPPFLRHMARAGQAGEPAADIFAQLLELDPGPLRLRKLQEHIRGLVASVLRIEPASIDLETPLGSLGIDSFTAIELRNRFERGLGLQLSATLAWNYPTIAVMAPYLAEKMGL